jgi:hypothetical protein
LITRRRVVESLAGMEASSLLTGFSSLSSPSSPSSTAPDLTNPQSTPVGSLTAASLTVLDVPNRSIGPAFAGLSYGKTEMLYPYFS